MRRAGLALVLLLPGLLAIPCRAAAAGFQKVSAHVFYMESKSGGWNTGAIVTAEGVLLVDPPPEPEIPALLASLKAVTTRTVRWVVSTDYQTASAAGLNALARQGATILLARELDRLAGSVPQADPTQPPAPRPNPRFLFSRQVQLYPEAVEIRILALKGKARTAGDVIVYYPVEKALFVGGFSPAGGFPVIDAAHGEGSAAGWIEALKQTIDFAPQLKSAIPPPKPETPPAKAAEPEKSSEELVAVITASGPPATLQSLKDLYAASQKMRSQASRSVAAGRSREDFIKSLPSDVFGNFPNFESFAGQLYDEFQKK
jgi:glyoxylase-like metal-dependent hydrolase (beta-lactamase superfamily II)